MLNLRIGNLFVDRLMVLCPRCLGQRWLKILFRMWQNRTTYAPDLHASNQLKHGSWLLKLQPK